MTVLAALPSTVPQLYTNLAVLLAAQPALSGVNISWSGPTQSAPDEIISFTVDQTDVTSAAIGSQRRSEKYDLMCVVAVSQNDVEGFNPFKRACTLRDVVSSVIRADATVGGAVIWALDQGSRVVNGSDGNWSGTQIIMKINCFARI
jgi:hypothetical protein